MNSEENTNFDIIDHIQTYNKIEKQSKKVTIPILSKYEKARIIGIRAQQLADGAISVIKIPSYVKNTVEIAEIELKERKIPLIVRRILSKDIYEDWRIEEFQLV